ncbi:AAA domain-containing protein [Mycena pura]|uniref:AAA domain-containing protein n=1 Tax=Mycena pura TaxID=153505 RepID=A0AAD6UM58_9AGAR|nr:AAA domain-containing protein [Mycena pura]
MDHRTEIYVVGPSSTGKTTLCNALAKRLGLTGQQFVTEVARDVIKALGLGRKDIGLLEMQKAIMLAHLEHDREGTTRLCDRSAIDPIVYAIFTATSPVDAQTRKQALISLPEFQAALPRYRNSMFILLTPVKEWLVDDGFRHVGDEMDILAIFRDILTDLGIQHREIGSEMRSLSERTEYVLSLATDIQSQDIDFPDGTHRNLDRRTKLKFFRSDSVGGCASGGMCRPLVS